MLNVMLVFICLLLASLHMHCLHVNFKLPFWFFLHFSFLLLVHHIMFYLPGLNLYIMSNTMSNGWCSRVTRITAEFEHVKIFTTCCLYTGGAYLVTSIMSLKYQRPFSGLYQLFLTMYAMMHGTIYLICSPFVRKCTT